MPLHTAIKRYIANVGVRNSPQLIASVRQISLIVSQGLDKESLKLALQKANQNDRATNLAKADEQDRPYF